MQHPAGETGMGALLREPCEAADARLEVSFPPSPLADCGGSLRSAKHSRLQLVGARQVPTRWSTAQIIHPHQLSFQRNTGHRNETAAPAHAGSGGKQPLGLGARSDP